MADVEQTMAIDPVPLLRKAALAVSLRTLADHIDGLTTETARGSVAELAIEFEATAKWLSDARGRLLDHWRALGEGAGS